MPKSTKSHASSTKFDDQRVPLSPSTAYFAAIASASFPDDVALADFATFVPDGTDESSLFESSDVEPETLP